MGGSASPGNGTLAIYFPGAQFAGRVLVEECGVALRPRNLLPHSIQDVGFAKLTGGDLSTAADEPANAPLAAER
jgi:hypothetical protein